MAIIFFVFLGEEPEGVYVRPQGRVCLRAWPLWVVGWCGPQVAAMIRHPPTAACLPACRFCERIVGGRQTGVTERE